MQNPKQEIKSNVRTRLEPIENYSRDEKCIERGITSSIEDFYCSGFPKSCILETTYNFAEKVSSRPREWKRMIGYLKKMYPEQSYRVRRLKNKLKNKLRRHKKKCTKLKYPPKDLKEIQKDERTEAQQRKKQEETATGSHRQNFSRDKQEKYLKH